MEVVDPAKIEQGLPSRKSSISSESSESSTDTDPHLETNVEDPWAIVELVDDSEKWAGKFLYQ